MIATAEKTKRAPSNEKCLCCDKPAIARGLCPACRRAADNAIKRREATEEELIERGFLLPAIKGRSGFAKKFYNLKTA
jgi:hypothetical protein